jgi:hypothetical protein
LGLIVLEACLLDTEIKITKGFNIEENFAELIKTVDTVSFQKIKKILKGIFFKKHDEYRPYFTEIML